MSPTRPSGPCTYYENGRGCPRLAVARGRCAEHQRPAWQGPTVGRGRDALGTAWRTIRALVLREEPICRVCGRAASTAVDHVVPVSLGGTHDRANLRGVCTPCHDRITGQQAAAARARRARA